MVYVLCADGTRIITLTQPGTALGNRVRHLLAHTFILAVREKQGRGRFTWEYPSGNRMYAVKYLVHRFSMAAGHTLLSPQHGPWEEITPSRVPAYAPVLQSGTLAQLNGPPVYVLQCAPLRV